jgi:hypothetical protein
MATLATKLAGGIVKADPADVAIPDVRADPTYAAASAQLGKLRAYLQLLEQQKLDLTINHALAGKPVNPRSTNDTSLRARRAALHADPSFTPAIPDRVASATAPSPVLAEALALADGDPMPPMLDRGELLAEIDRRHGAVRQGIFLATEIVERIEGELSFRFSTELRPAWDALHLELYRASQGTARAVARLQTFRNSMIAAGIKPRSDVIKMCPVRAPLMLGSESDWNSEIAQWRRQLEEWSLI